MRAIIIDFGAMKGFVPTPFAIVDLMVEKLFSRGAPGSGSTLLDPGCGEGEFIAGVLRWCAAARVSPPRIVGIEAHQGRASAAVARFAGCEGVEIRTGDFLRASDERFDFIIANPPYVPITDLSISERETFRREYSTACGRFDLYLLFFEQALRALNPAGRLVFITPEKYLYVDSARPLRQLLLDRHVETLHFLDEQTFGDLVTYPLISTIAAERQDSPTQVIHRSGSRTAAHLDAAESWLPTVLGHAVHAHAPTLADACIRISCGVATGADSVFVVRSDQLPDELAPFAYPTIAGRHMADGVPLASRTSMLVPYDAAGDLLAEEELGPLAEYLGTSERRAQLLRRTCIARRRWYAFHENPPMREMLRPKLLCKDITAKPFFLADTDGAIIPRHSTYYVVPKDSSSLDELAAYLNSGIATDWLRAHCQRAANGFLRVQSQVLKQLPIPASLVPAEASAREAMGDLRALPA